MSKTAWVGGIIIAVVLIGGGYWFMNKPAAAVAPVADTTSGDAMTATPADQTAPSADTVPTDTVSAGVDVGVSTAPMTATVKYDGSTYTPSTVTIAKGGSVTFIDSDSRGMWLASDPHPSHTGYDGTSRGTHCAPGYSGAAPFDQCAIGAKFTFTFNKTGSWGYHDHLNDSAMGTVVVK